MQSGRERQGTVVVVDDSDVAAEVLRRQLVADGYGVEVASDGPSGIETIHRVAPDVVLLDVAMPGMDGLEVCRRLKSHPATCLTPVVLVATLDDREDRLRGAEAGADDFLAKPVDLERLRARLRALIRAKHVTDELDSVDAVMLNLARTVDARDQSTKGHCDRVAAYASAIGVELALSPEEMVTLHRGALLHDVGKVGVPDAILLKFGRLTDAEFEAMKRHTMLGDQICTDFRALRDVRGIVRWHHERRDGSGYPDGLTGARIPLLAQVVGVADVFDAMTTARPYKPALSFRDAVAVLRDEAARGQRNATLVEILVGLHDNGELQRAIAASKNSAIRPGGLSR